MRFEYGTTRTHTYWSKTLTLPGTDASFAVTTGSEMTVDEVGIDFGGSITFSSAGASTSSLLSLGLFEGSVKQS